MAKQMVFDDEARQPLAAGVAKLARAVRSTLGPRGRNAVLDKGWGSPKVTKDGVTVAEDIELDDPYREPRRPAGQGSRQQDQRRRRRRHDDGHRSGRSDLPRRPEDDRRGRRPDGPFARHRQGGRDRVARPSRRWPRRSTTRTRKRFSRSPRSPATTTRRSASVLADAFLKVGKDGVITVEEGKQAETTVEVVEGMQFDRGFLSPHFVTNQDEQTVELENAYVLIYEEKISSAKNLVPLLEAISKAGKPLLIIAEDVEGEALATLVVNKMRGILQVCAVKAPGYGDRRKAMLGDLAVLTGGTAIFKDLGISLDAVKLTDLGRAKKFRITSEETTVVGGAGKKEEIDGRAEQIRKEIENTDSEYDREKLQERLAKLAGGVAQINVGAATETEMKERKYLLEDAKSATQGGAGRGHRARRRRGIAPQRKGARRTETRRRRGAGRADRSRRARLPAASASPTTPASTARSSSIASGS